MDIIDDNVLGLNSTMDRQERVCEKHGLYKSSGIRNPLTKKVMLWSKCPECQDEVDKKKEKEERKLKSCKDAEKVKDILKKSGIPKRFKDKTFSNYIVSNKSQENVLNLCKKYASNFDKVLENGVNLLMIGNSGTGKNHLATAIANELLEKNYSILFSDVFIILSDIKYYQSSDKHKLSEKLNEYSIPDLLVIDEIGDQVGSESDKRLLNKLINIRYNNVKPTILISNMMYSSNDGSIDLKNFLGSRIITRLGENSGKILQFDWDNYRFNIKSEGIW